MNEYRVNVTEHWGNCKQTYVFTMYEESEQAVIDKVNIRFETKMNVDSKGGIDSIDVTVTELDSSI